MNLLTHGTQEIMHRKPLGFWRRAQRDIISNKQLYLMIIPVLAFYIIFRYAPMYGAIIAFKDFVPAKGIMGSEWVGLKHFFDYFSSYYFNRTFGNTLLLSLYSITIGFTAPILLALTLNEVRHMSYKKWVQTFTYIPHFISLVVICGLIIDFTSTYGLINDIAETFGFERQAILQNPKLFRPVYIISEIWQECGWNSIIYIAALSCIDPELYDSAMIDGAGRLRRLVHITLPSIIPTIIIVFILRLGKVMEVSFEKIILLYNPSIYSTADVISSFVYRKGLLENNYSYSSAVGLFNSAINFAIVIIANAISRKVNETSLW